MPVDHICIRVPPAKYEETISFYLKALAPLDYVEIKRFEGVVGLGAGGKPDFWISSVEGASEQSGTHMAFSTESEENIPHQDGWLLTRHAPRQSAPSSTASTTRR